MTDPDPTAAAPPPGYQPFGRHGAFAQRIGPFFLRPDGDGGWRYALQLDRRHLNPNGIAHGGALYSFADQFLGHAIVHRLHRMCATVKLKVEFLSAARPGHLVEGDCDIVRASRTMAFVRARVRSGGTLLMTADGTFKLLAPIDPARLTGPSPPEPPVPDVAPPEPPTGFKPFRLQGAFADFYGPMYYRQEADGGYVCGMQATPAHDNSTGVVHGGALLAFADDALGRAIAATSRRYTATIGLDAQYLAPGPLDAWLTARAEITRMARSLAFARCEVMNGDKPVFHADAIFRLFARYDDAPARGTGGADNSREASA